MSSSFGFFGTLPNTQLAVALALLIGSGLPSRSEPVGTSFSYRGSLSINGSPANAIYDLKFTIFDSLANGIQASPTITNAAVVVTNGIFNVALDFGTNVFTGEKRWLEVGVRPSGDPSDFELLTPRQELARLWAQRRGQECTLHGDS